tara:strand:+ start:179 stop:1063 length:885 start_codon:yes stop_codon:yes gene_type:complete
VKIFAIVPEDPKVNAESTECRIAYKVLNCIKAKGISIITNLENFSEEDINSCDIILCISGSEHDTEPLYKKFAIKYPHMKRILYLWDLYPWVKKYNIIPFPFYNEIWVPSNEVSLRVKELYSSSQKTKIIKCFFESFEGEKARNLEKDFIFHPLRAYKDSNYRFLEKACEKLNINVLRPEHSLTFDEYKQAILNCSFLVCEYSEASTGGLSLLEGYYHGKNVLLSDSKYQGGKDYFGDRAFYFKDGDLSDFIDKVDMLHKKSKDPVDLQDRRSFCKIYSKSAMATRVINALKEI